MAGLLSSLIFLLRPQKKNKAKVSKVNRRCAHCGASFSVASQKESGRCPNCGRPWQKKDS